MPELEHLQDLLRYDPDGKPDEPTEEDYAAFKAFAVERYGESTYYAYIKGGWAPAPEV